jgi:hypothetical protein
MCSPLVFMCFILIGAAVSLLYCTVLYCTVLYLGHVLSVDLHVLHSYRSCCKPAVLYVGYVLLVDLPVLHLQPEGHPLYPLLPD